MATCDQATAGCRSSWLFSRRKVDHHQRLIRFGPLLGLNLLLLMGWALVACNKKQAPSQDIVTRYSAQPVWDRADAGVEYGPSNDLPLPRTIIFSASPDFIIDTAEEFARRGIGGFFVDFIAREWADNIWARDGKPYTIGPDDGLFQKTVRANRVCRKVGIEDNFLKIAFDHPFNWFNDIAWQHAYHNFRQFAIFARETGCKGLALDIEYIHEQYHFDWPGYTYDGYTREDLVRTIGQRMTRVAQVMYEEFPDMVFLTFPEQNLGLGQLIHLAWIEEAARREAPGGIHYCVESTYRKPNARYVFGYAWQINWMFHRLLSERAWRYWTERCTIAAAVWPFGFNYQNVLDPGMDVDDFRQGYAANLMVSSRYNWIYSHNAISNFLPRGDSLYHGSADIAAYRRIIAEREIITNPKKYMALARELRDMKLRDYSGDLDVIPVLHLDGPYDQGSVTLEPASDPATIAMRSTQDELWQVALASLKGRPTNIRDRYDTITRWQVIGPFESAEHAGYERAYPPERELDLDGEYPGKVGTVRWQVYGDDSGAGSVDLLKVMDPPDWGCAYALTYVTSPERRKVQIRLGTNDLGKMWVDGKLVFEHPQEGRALLDKHIVPVELPAGKTPVLLKVCQSGVDWGFYFRITDEDGRRVRGIVYGLE